MVDDHVEIVTFSLPEAVRALSPVTTPTRADGRDHGTGHPAPSLVGEQTPG